MFIESDSLVPAGAAISRQMGGTKREQNEFLSLMCSLRRCPAATLDHAAPIMEIIEDFVPWDCEYVRAIKDPALSLCAVLQGYQVISCVKGVLCFEICTPSLFSPSPLCRANFITRHALNLWPNNWAFNFGEIGGWQIGWAWTRGSIWKIQIVIMRSRARWAWSSPPHQK